MLRGLFLPLVAVLWLVVHMGWVPVGACCLVTCGLLGPLCDVGLCLVVMGAVRPVVSGPLMW